MGAAVLALVLANGPFADAYQHLLHLPLGVAVGGWGLEKTLHHWVNDGLMVIFFFVVGLEIKRELLVGELSSPKRAALPMFAALGGMIFPALIYLAFNKTGISHSGWGIPMATDIAFAVGILTLLGKRVPFVLKVFLLALAIVDDLGAVLVIAFFYTAEISTHALGLAVLGLAITYIMRYAGIRKHLVYVVLGVWVWLGFLKSGVHATVAGVLIGLVTPLDRLYALTELPSKLKQSVDGFIAAISGNNGDENLTYEAVNHLEDLHHTVVEAQLPIDRFIHMLHPWVGFVIMPIFALINAGVTIEGVSFSEVLSHNITVGVILGLLVGKPIGVFLLSYIAVKLKIADLPQGVTWFHVVGVGFLAGIGFTMALFISNLALKTPELEIYSKVGILTASVLAGIVGSILLLMGKSEKASE